MIQASGHIRNYPAPTNTMGTCLESWESLKNAKRMIEVNRNLPHKGHTLWCAVGAGTSRRTLSWSQWHHARLIKEWGCVDLSMNTLHLKYPLVLFGCEGSALTLPLFLLSPRIIMLCHCSSTMTKDHFLLMLYDTKWPLCAIKHLFIHSFKQEPTESKLQFLGHCVIQYRN